jgi:BirA family biotin operon repressor/biotin-[acetyl-CoA-carboxylase] ligase
VDAADHVGRSEPESTGPEPWPSGWVVQHVAETGSTNADLIAAAAAGAPDRSVLYADHQTAGRGRLDRTWIAPPGENLLVSLLFRHAPDDAGELTRRVGLAAIGAAARCAGVEAKLKWPNDVLVGDGKLAGILAQRSGDGSVVVGIGLNVGSCPEGAARLGDAATPEQVLRAMLVAYDALPADIDSMYRRELSTLGQRVRVELPHDEIIGTAIDIEPDGRLVVLDDCALTHRVTVGDVIHLRRA